MFHTSDDLCLQNNVFYIKNYCDLIIRALLYISFECHSSVGAHRIVVYCLQYFFDVIWNQTSHKNTCLLKLIERQLQVYEKNMSHEPDLV